MSEGRSHVIGDQSSEAYRRHIALMRHSKEKSAKNICTSADFEELRKAYRFVPEQNKSTKKSTWQERMVQHYHSRLFKEYAIADLSRYKQGAVGLRWRTEKEVVQGKGHFSCGNKHCPVYHANSYAGTNHDNILLLKQYYATSLNFPGGLSKDRDEQQLREKEEISLLKKLSHGIGLYSYEVNFAYKEDGHHKNELVKLRLCLRCAPLLFHLKVSAITGITLV
mmetsp:Transcript_6588/g.9611  ORF Transcript_6588/g.9611 Transcript_6588/m.9611 type:complete len:223 (-) Transcript_6588:635-1303(-)